MRKRKLLMGALLLLMISICGILLARDLNKPFAVGYDIYNFNIKMDSFIFKPQNTATKLQIDVSYLPECKYLKNLPVIYMTDGQWRRMDHKYIHYLTYKKIIPPMIAVGIGYPEEYDANRVRVADLFSSPDNFLQAIKNDIIPLVESKYSVNPQNRIIFGTSLGGHFSAYAFVKNSLADDGTFWGYIGSSPFFLGSGAKVLEMARELVSKEQAVRTGLYLAYGAKEGDSDFKIPNNTLYNILESKTLKDFRFYHYVYPGSDHYTNTRLTLIDGLRLLLGNENAQGIGAVDLNYKSYKYDFKTTTQYYDWQSSIFAQNSYSADPKYSVDKEPGSFRVSADFTKYNTLTFNTSSVYFEGIADREMEFNVYVPESLAKLNYSLKFLIYSSFSLQWIPDTSEGFKLNKSGWNTFKYKWRGKRISGNIDCIRGFGVNIERNGVEPGWKGDLYFDDIKWQ